MDNQQPSVEKEWRTVIEYNKYEVNQFGEIRHKKRKQILKPRKNKSGYEYVNFRINGINKNFAIKNGFGEEIENLEKRSKEFNKVFVKKLQLEQREPNKEIFCENSMKTRAVVKRRILADNLLEYKCAICGNLGEHNGLPLVLQLDHINGIANDHRLENLRWLCPNCHSQTENFCSKNIEERRSKEREKQLRLAKEKTDKNKLLEQRKKYFDSIDTTKFGWLSQAEKDLGISHTQIKRWLKKYYPEKEVYQRKSPS